MKEHSSYQELKIIRTFIDQVNTASYSDITVKSLTKAAGVNRTQFYQFFSDKSDLAEFICYSFLDEFNSDLRATFNYRNHRELLANLMNAFNHLSDSAETLRALWAINDKSFSPYLIMQESMEDTILECLIPDAAHDSLNKRMLAATFSASAMATIRIYFDNGLREREQIVNNICACLLDGMETLRN